MADHVKAVCCINMTDITKKLADEFGIKREHAVNIIDLIDEGNTIPFIARYRKEKTGGIDDQVLRQLHDRLKYLRSLEERKGDVSRLIDEQGGLDDEVKRNLERAVTLREVEDIYRPFRPKRKTRASAAREKGLEPLADLLFEKVLTEEEIQKEALAFVDAEKGIKTGDEALAGAMDIIAERISDDACLRKVIRKVFMKEGNVHTTAVKERNSVYSMYYDFREKILRAAPHRLLAIFRGEREGYLNIEIEVPHEKIRKMIRERYVKESDGAARKYIASAADDAYERLILPSVDNEVRGDLKQRASGRAVKVFAENLRHLLLQPPVKGRVVMGLDPAYRTGCKIAVVDDTGKVLDTAVVYPTPPQNRKDEAKRILTGLIEKHSVDIISIGNGTASRESEIFVADMIGEMDREIYYLVVSEAGASVYSASKLGAEEFPDFDVSLRSAVSIARRLQDPLAELVKVDPKSIGVGLYQHDMNKKNLEEALFNVVEDCVNSVGVDINTASPSLLSYVSGISGSMAKRIVEYREKNGRFKTRQELMGIKNLGSRTFEQCAGFMRIPGGENLLDNTAVHPESYEATWKLLRELGYEDIDNCGGGFADIDVRLEEKGIDELADKTGAGVPTLTDIVKELKKPGRDSRDELPKPVFRKDVMKPEDLRPGMELTGTVRNVIDFGAFVDIGVHLDGLVHISELSDSYVKDPMDIVNVGDIVRVRVLSVDIERSRINLTLKGAGR